MKSALQTEFSLLPSLSLLPSGGRLAAHPSSLRPPRAAHMIYAPRNFLSRRPNRRQREAPDANATAQITSRSGFPGREESTAFPPPLRALETTEIMAPVSGPRSLR